MIKRYLEDRDEAMLAYPDTSKLEKLIDKWPGVFPPDFKRRLRKASPGFKTLVLEKMILQWAEAPEELIIKIKQRRGLISEDDKDDSGLLEED
jgi:hypothetical protein